METQKNDEKNIVLELKHQLGRMMVQVDYMYRNDREMSRLDLDIMMERTRDLYDLLCDYQAGKSIENEPINTEMNEGGELINRDVDLEVEKPVEEEPVEVVTKHILEVDESDFCDDEHEIHHPELIDKTPETPDDDSPSDEIVDEPEKTVDEPTDEPADEEEDWEDEDDEMFRVEQPVEELQETLVEVEDAEEETVQEPEDNSLAAKLQRAHVSDIRLALGINDKVMIINELFMGSVERYNKSIDALNDFPTLSGARVYMSELQIELQWDTESPAYKMLNDLVERRFV